MPPQAVALEPPRGAFFAARLLQQSGLDLLRSMMTGRVPQPPVTRLTGIQVTDVGLAACTMSMPATAWWQSAANGVFLAGTLAFVADGAVGGAVMTAAPVGHAMSSASLSLDFVRPATMQSANLIARGALLHSTRSQGIAEVSVEDGFGRLLAHGTSRGVIVPLPPNVVDPPPRDSEGSPDPYLREATGDVLVQAFWDTSSGADFVRALVSGECIPPVAQLTGLRVTASAEGSATCTMPRSGWLCNGFGTVYGGAIALLADFAQNTALLTRLPAATAYAPLDLRVSFLRPVLPDDDVVVAGAEVIQLGRTIALTRCEIADAAGRCVAVASESMMVLPQRSWARPIDVSEEALAGD